MFHCSSVALFLHPVNCFIIRMWDVRMRWSVDAQLRRWFSVGKSGSQQKMPGPASYKFASNSSAPQLLLIGCDLAIIERTLWPLPIVGMKEKKPRVFPPFNSLHCFNRGFPIIKLLTVEIPRRLVPIVVAGVQVRVEILKHQGVNIELFPVREKVQFNSSFDPVLKKLGVAVIGVVRLCIRWLRRKFYFHSRPCRP